MPPAEALSFGYRQTWRQGALLARLKREFATVRDVKPKASRANSAELCLLATGFKGRTL